MLPGALLRTRRTLHHELSRRMRAWLTILAVILWSGIGVAAPSFRELVGMLQNGEDFRVRVTAALELGKLSDPNAVDPLVDALNDPNASVRAAAAAALEQIGDASAL